MKSLNAILPRLVFYLALAMIAAGIIMRGVGLAEFQRIWDNLLVRPGGSLAFRFLLQPAMSTIFAVRDGIKDARKGGSPYFWTVLSDPNERLARLHEGVAATGKIILLGILIDGLSGHRVQDLLPGRSAKSRALPGVHPISADPWSGHAHRRPMATPCRCGRNSVSPKQ